MTDTPTPLTTDLSGEVAIVTGATSGLGLRFAEVLAGAGAAVAITGRRADRLEELKARLEGEGARVLALPGDMTKTDDILSMVADTEAALGLPTILVNNAGMADAAFATKIDIGLIDRVLDLNLRAPFIASREVARHLIKAERPGRIVNIASIMAYHYSGEGAALYSTTKAAIVRMTETLAVEWARYHVNVNAIAPGYVKSEMTDAMSERMERAGMASDLASTYPRRRLPTPDYLDSTLLFLCDPASHGVTGTVVKMDDGQTPR